MENNTNEQDTTTQPKIAKAKLKHAGDGYYYADIEGVNETFKVAVPSMGNQKWETGQEVVGVILPETNLFHICRDLHHVRKGTMFGITLKNDVDDEWTKVLVMEDFKPKMMASVSFYTTFYEEGEELGARKSLISNF